MTDNLIFQDLPDGEVITDGWREHYAPIAFAAKQTSWGLQDSERRILGLCQMLENYEQEFCAAGDDRDTMRERIEELERQIKGKQLENGRLKKRIEKLEADKE